MKLIDKNGQQFTYTYNNRNFQTTKNAPDEQISFTYDNAGNRKTMTDITGTTSYTYKASTGELTGVTFPDGRSIQYQYDSQGNRTKMTDPFGGVVSYSYNGLNQLFGVGTAANNYEAVYSYMKNGLLKEGL